MVDYALLMQQNYLLFYTFVDVKTEVGLNDGLIQIIKPLQLH